jgi:predicted ester cyclase
MGTLQTPDRVAPEAGDVNIEVIARAIYDNFNLRLLDESALWVSDRCEWLDVPSGTVFRGPDGYVEFDQAWIRAFPDAQLEISNMVASGDLVCTELSARGTHEGPLIGPTGKTIEATGRPVEMRCIEVQQYGGGQIVRARFYYDALSLLRQLGVEP